MEKIRFQTAEKNLGGIEIPAAERSGLIPSLAEEAKLAGLYNIMD